MNTDPIYIDEDNDVTWGHDGEDGAYANGSYLNSATVTYVLKNSAGATLDSGTLSYVAASNGCYRGVIESTVTADLTENAIYTLEITLVEGSVNGFRKLYLRAQYHSAA